MRPEAWSLLFLLEGITLVTLNLRGVHDHHIPEASR